MRSLVTYTVQLNPSLHVNFLSDKIVLKCVKTHDSRILISNRCADPDGDRWSGPPPPPKKKIIITSSLGFVGNKHLPPPPPPHPRKKQNKKKTTVVRHVNDCAGRDFQKTQSVIGKWTITYFLPMRGSREGYVVRTPPPPEKSQVI